MKISRELKVGFVSITALVLLYYGFNFLKGQDVFKSKKVVYAVYDYIDGLSVAKPAYMNGFKVGQVDNIVLHPDGSGRLIVSINLTTDFHIPKNSQAIIKSTDLLGDKAIGIHLGDSKELLEEGDTMRSSVELSLTEEVNRQMAPLKNKIEKLFGSVDTVLIMISGFLTEDSQKDFGKTFNSLYVTFERLESTMSNLDTTMAQSKNNIVSSFDHIESITRNLDENGEELSAIFANLNSITDSLAAVRFKETFEHLNAALATAEQVLQKLENGEGSAGLLINDPELYNNLNSAAEELDELLLDLKHNPKRYIDLSLFGGKKKYDEAENRRKEAEAEQKVKESGQ